jgi:predicted GNAT family N-acyltransferase
MTFLPNAPITVETGSWVRMKEDARAVRDLVFIQEQQVPRDLEWDEWDDDSLHALARHGSQVMGTGRLLPVRYGAEATVGHIGRMAVLKAARGTGVGSMILRALMAAAPAYGFTAIVLHAQTHAVPFYLRHGYVTEGDEYLEADIPHFTMRALL